MGAGWGEDLSPSSALSSPLSKSSVSPGGLAKAILLHKHISWLGSRAVPSPRGRETIMAPVGMTQLTLSPLDSDWAWSRQHDQGRGCSGRDMGGDPAAPLLWVTPWHHQGSPGEVLLPFGMQALFPSCWPADTHPSLPPCVQAV